MADLLRGVTVERGHDPRDFVLFAGGGQGPSHAWALCRELGIDTFVVTPTATAQSALGTGTTDLRQSAQHPCYTRIPPGTKASDEALAGLGDALGCAEAAARDRLRDSTTAGGPHVAVERSLALRYRGQAHHLDIPVGPEPMDPPLFEGVVDVFEREYEALFGAGSAFREAGLEVLSARAIVTVVLPSHAPSVPTERLVQSGRRAVIFDDPGSPMDCPIWTVSFPGPGQRVVGPALVVYPGQTAVIPPGAVGTTDELGNLVVRLTTPGLASTIPEPENAT